MTTHTARLGGRVRRRVIVMSCAGALVAAGSLVATGSVGATTAPDDPAPTGSAAPAEVPGERDAH